MSKDKVKEYKAWFKSPLSLEEIGSRLVKIGVIRNYSYDYENVYEWFVAETENEDLDFNVSRKHREGEGFEEEPIGILAIYSKQKPENIVVEKFAKSIAREFNCKVLLGFIEYLGGDDYEYRSTSEVT